MNEQEANVKATFEGALAAEKTESLDAESLARVFHEAYERLAPQYGYETREETREFDPDSMNGRLIVATCEHVIGHLAARAHEELGALSQHLETREHQVTSLCSLVGVAAEEELEARIKALVESKKFLDEIIGKLHRVFQKSENNPEPVLPDFVKWGGSMSDGVVRLAEDYARLKRGELTGDELQQLCHNLDNEHREAFCDGCDAHQRKLFGTSRTDQLRDLLYGAWTLIANAAGGNWDREAADWRAAAKQWRDRYHESIGAPEPGRPDVTAARLQAAKAWAMITSGNRLAKMWHSQRGRWTLC